MVCHGFTTESCVKKNKEGARRRREPHSTDSQHHRLASVPFMLTRLYIIEGVASHEIVSGPQHDAAPPRHNAGEDLRGERRVGLEAALEGCLAPARLGSQVSTRILGAYGAFNTFPYS